MDTLPYDDAHASQIPVPEDEASDRVHFTTHDGDIGSSEWIDEDDEAYWSMCNNFAPEIDAFAASVHTHDSSHNSNNSTHTWSKDEAFVTFTGPWCRATCFYMDMRDGSSFRVEDDTDMLSAEDMVKFEHLVKQADADELKSFVHHGVFKVCKREFVRMRPMTCVWVRRWKYKMVDGKKQRVIKSRLCVRGFLDPQKA